MFGSSHRSSAAWFDCWYTAGVQGVCDDTRDDVFKFDQGNSKSLGSLGEIAGGGIWEGRIILLKILTLLFFIFKKALTDLL